VIVFCDIGGAAGWTDFLPQFPPDFEAAGSMLTADSGESLGAGWLALNAIAPGRITMPWDPPEWHADFMRRAPLKSGRPE